MYTAAMLDKDRYKVDVISGPQTGSEGSLIEEVRKKGIPLTVLPDLVREISPIKDLAALLRMYWKMKDGKYQIVHTHSSKAGILGRLAANLAGVPVIIHTVHGWSFHDRMSKVRRFLYIRLERLVASWSDALIVVTKQDITKGLDNGIGSDERYHLIRSAIPGDEFAKTKVNKEQVRLELGIPEDVPVVGNIGRFSAQKNPLDWIRVANGIATQIPDCWFLLVGDGPLRVDVETLAKEYGIFDQMIFTGLRRDVSSMLAAMDVFLLTSLWEGLPRVIPQAFAMEIPVVANSVDGTQEAIEHGENGYLCNPGEIDRMAKYCIDLINNSSRRHRMGKQGHLYSNDEFNLGSMINEIETLYEKCMH